MKRSAQFLFAQSLFLAVLLGAVAHAQFPSQIQHVVIVNVPPGKGEPAHEHADVRFFMATQTPQEARPENAAAALRWLSLTEAYDATSEPNLRETLTRMQRLLAP